MATPEYVSDKECRPLYDLIGRVRDMAPWDWMYEDDLFAVQSPETGELGFVSIMGHMGEHYAVAVYLGLRGLAGFRHLQDAGPFLDPEALFKVPQLQASLEDRNFLEQDDRDQIKRLGLKYRGRTAWPMFRSLRPGYVPWFLSPDEARYLAHVLGQVLEVAPRVRDNPGILFPSSDSKFLVRRARQEGSEWVWQDATKKVGPPPAIDLTIEIPHALLDAVKELPRRRARVEVDYFMIPNGIYEKGQRPFFPFSLMMADATNKAIIGMELLTPVPTIESMWSNLGGTVVQMLYQNGWVPTEIRVSDDLLYFILAMLAPKTGLKVKLVNELPMIDDAADGLMGFLNRS